jgi:hypothetical protein
MYSMKETHADKTILAAVSAFDLDRFARSSLLMSADRKTSFRKVRLENGAVLTFVYETNYAEGKITRVLIAKIQDGNKEQQEAVEAINATAREFDRSRR